MIVIIMGVSGSGKTTVGCALSDALDAAFIDADDFHPPANVARMSRGEPLDDADRQPWLELLNRELHRYQNAGQRVILACSALKADYRETLTRSLTPPVHLVYLQVDRKTLHERMTARVDHFMPAALLDSQLQSLEEPTDAIVVDAARPVGEIVPGLVHRLTRQ